MGLTSHPTKVRVQSPNSKNIYKRLTRLFKKKSSYWHANRTPLPTLSAMIGGALTILVFYCLEKPHIGFKRGRVGTSTLEFNIFNALLSKQPTTDCICIIAELPHDARRCTMASGFRAFTLTPTLN